MASSRGKLKPAVAFFLLVVKPLSYCSSKLAEDSRRHLSADPCLSHTSIVFWLSRLHHGHLGHSCYSLCSLCILYCAGPWRNSLHTLQDSDEFSRYVIQNLQKVLYWLT